MFVPIQTGIETTLLDKIKIRETLETTRIRGMYGVIQIRETLETTRTLGTLGETQTREIQEVRRTHKEEVVVCLHREAPLDRVEAFVRAVAQCNRAVGRDLVEEEVAAAEDADNLKYRNE